MNSPTAVRAATIARLEELRLSCREELIEAELALGRHAELIPSWRRSCASNPSANGLEVS